MPDDTINIYFYHYEASKSYVSSCVTEWKMTHHQFASRAKKFEKKKMLVKLQSSIWRIEWLHFECIRDFECFRCGGICITHRWCIVILNAYTLLMKTYDLSFIRSFVFTRWMYYYYFFFIEMMDIPWISSFPSLFIFVSGIVCKPWAFAFIDVHKTAHTRGLNKNV